MSQTEYSKEYKPGDNGMGRIGEWRIWVGVVVLLVIGIGVGVGIGSTLGGMDTNHASMEYDEMVMFEEPSRESRGRFAASKMEIMPQIEIDYGDGRIVVKNAQISYSAPDAGQAHLLVIELIRESQGYVENSQQSTKAHSSISITARIPSDSFTGFLRNLETNSKKHDWNLQNSRVWTEDISTQFIDVNARIEVLQSTFDKLKTLLEESKTVQDSLQVHRELNNIQQQLEAKKSVQQHLKSKRDFSTVSLTLSSTPISKPDVIWPFNRVWVFISLWKAIFETFLDISLFVLILVVPAAVSYKAVQRFR